MNYKIILAFVIGASAGAGGMATYFIPKYKKMEKLHEDELQSMRDQLSDYIWKENEKQEKDFVDSFKEVEKGDTTESPSEALKRSVTNSKPVVEGNSVDTHKIDYSAFYEPYGVSREDKQAVKGQVEDFEESESEEEPETDENEEASLEVEEFNRAHANDPPKIIKKEEFGELDWFTEDTLLYYQIDDTLVVESDEHVLAEEEIPLYVGDCLDRFNFYNNADTEINVRNFKMCVDYKVLKIEAAYA